MPTREYNFIVGPETSTLPDIGTPSASTDLLSLGYADNHYTMGRASVADLTALKAISDAGDYPRQDGELVIVQATNTAYIFDSGSSATGDDNKVVTPSSGTGRWIKVAENQLTASRALQSDANGAAEASSVTSTELGYLSGVNTGIVDIGSSQSISGAKTFTAATTNDLEQIQKEIATPSNPASGYQKMYPKTDGKWYTLDDSGIETQVGAGSGGSGINDITNGTAEDGTTTGWAVYADTAGSQPVDGTGGSPTVTWTTTSSQPLIGSYSFVFTKDANNRQGEGSSFDFSIDRIFINSMRFIEFYVEPGANYVTDDIQYFIYDVTNANLIVPQGSVTSSGYGSFSFPTSDSTSYRFIIHVASTNASGYTLKYDNFRIGPDSLVDSPIYEYLGSLTTTGSWTTNVSYTGEYWREGEFLVGQARVLCSGAPDATLLTFNLPTSLGVTINSSKIANTSSYRNYLGNGLIDQAATAVFNVVATYVGTTSIGTSVGLTSGTYNNFSGITDTVPITFGSGDGVMIWYKVPILEWANDSAVLSTTEMKNEVVKASAGLGTSHSLTSAAIIPFDTESIDTHNAFNASTGVFTAPKTGYYLVSVAATSLDFTDNILNVAIRVNGTSVRRRDMYKSSAITRVSGTVTALVYVQKDQTIDAYADAHTGQTLPIGTQDTYISIVELPDFSVYSVYGKSESITETVSTSTAYPTGSDQWVDLDTITFPEGEWDVDSEVSFLSDGATTTTSIFFGLGATSGNNGPELSELSYQTKNSTSGSYDYIANSIKGLIVSSETTYYLKAYAVASIANLKYISRTTARKVG